MAKTHEETLATARAWKAKNKERVAAYRAEYWKQHKAREKETMAAWRAKNRHRKPGYDRVHRERHASELKLKRSSPEYKTWRRSYQRARYTNDVAYRIEMVLRASFTQALRLQGIKKQNSINSLIGCSLPELKGHLERQFLPGMSWTNHGEWHIDHKRPCASFDLSDPGQQRACFHYKNLQPLWALDNLRKQAKI